MAKGDQPAEGTIVVGGAPHQPATVSQLGSETAPQETIPPSGNKPQPGQDEAPQQGQDQAARGVEDEEDQAARGVEDEEDLAARGVEDEEDLASDNDQPYEMTRAAAPPGSRQAAFDEFLDLLPSARELATMRAEETGLGARRSNQQWEIDHTAWLNEEGNDKAANDREVRALLYDNLGEDSRIAIRESIPDVWIGDTTPEDNPFLLPFDLAHTGDQFLTTLPRFMRSQPKPADIARSGKTKTRKDPSPPPPRPTSPRRPSFSPSPSRRSPSHSPKPITKPGPSSRSGGKGNPKQVVKAKVQKAKASSPPPAKNKVKSTAGQSKVTRRSPSPTDESNIKPVAHPPYQGVPGEAIDTLGSKVTQATWERWPVYDRWTDYDNGGIPPAYVRLDDWNLWHVCDLPHAKRRGRWPADLDNDGNIRRSRANYGYPAKMKDKGVWKYLVFKTIYQLCGNEKDASISTLKGTADDMKGQVRPYFSLGDKAKVQSYTGPIRHVGPTILPGSSSSSKDAPTTLPKPKAPATAATTSATPTPGHLRHLSNAASSIDTMAASSSPARTSYLEKRKRGFVDSDDEEEMILDPPQPDNTINLIRQILLVDEELGSRLHAEGKAKKEAISATRRALRLQEASYEFHKETVRITAERLTEDLPKVLKEGLPQAKAQAAEKERLEFTPTKRWKGLKVEPQE